MIPQVKKAETMKLAIRSILTMSIVLIMLYVVILTNVVFGQIPDGDIELTDPQEKTLGLAERFTRDSFIIEASDFYEGAVVITVYDNTVHDDIINDVCIPYCTSNIVSKTIAKMGDSWNVTDRSNVTKMNIEIKDLKAIKGNLSAYEGLNVVVDSRVKIRTMLVGRPIPKLSIIPKERKSNNRTFVDRVFDIGSEISINFSIKNEGKATLRRMHLVLNKSDVKDLPFLVPGEMLDRELPDLKANETEIITIRFRAPYVEKRRNFTISGSVIGEDAFGRKYNVTDSTFIIIKPYVENIIEVKKYVPAKMYMGDIAYVTLYINNNGWKDINGLNLIEDIPTGFESLDDMWNLSNFTLKAHENKLVMYKLRPKRPGIYIFPEKSSMVEWNNSIESDVWYNTKPNKLIVNGPYVELKKTGIIKGDNIEIKIYAKNLGDMTAIVRLTDLVPKNGAMRPSLVVRPGSTTTFLYNVNRSNVVDMISDGSVRFPPATAVILDQFLFSNERYTQKAISNNLTINTADWN